MVWLSQSITVAREVEIVLDVKYYNWEKYKETEN